MALPPTILLWVLLVMTPTLKKLNGHIALGLSVRASISASIRPLQI